MVLPTSLDYVSATPTRIGRWWLWALPGVAFLACAVALSLPVSQTLRTPGFDSRARADVARWGCAAAAFRRDVGRLPTAAEGLPALMSQPPGLTSWAGPYIDHARLNDPWGRPYVYAAPSGAKAGSPAAAVLTAGADGTPRTADDITFTVP